MNDLPIEIAEEKAERSRVAVIPKGSWIISFELELFMKDSQVNLKRLVTDKRNLVEAISQETVVDSIVAEFIKQNYHDSQVDVVGVKDFRIRDARALGMKKVVMKGRHL